MKYLVPEYYKHFKCKCGECRHSCCDGWPIRISTKEYYHLLGINCSDRLRSRLDCALKDCLNSSKESYKQISTDWRGICMLHREDGLCALQMELGESNLPEVCNLYPRNTKHLNESNHCSCSNSCEQVVELLINLKGTMRFEEIDLPIKPEFSINLSTNKYECSNKSITIIQNRSQSLSDRFITLGNFILGSETLPLTKPNDLSPAFYFLHKLNLYYEDNESISDYNKESQTYFDISDKEKLGKEDLIRIAVKYKSALEHQETILPDWMILFEQLIVNHMFYNHFPYPDNKDDVKASFISLIIIYSFLRFHFVGYLSNHLIAEPMVDFLAAMFRLIEHSNFKQTAYWLFIKEKCTVNDCMIPLIYL